MNRASATTPWVTRPKPKPEAALRLFCFPYAGGSTVIYRQWPDGLPPDVEVCAVQLPGRGAHLRTPPHTRMGPLVAELGRELRPYFDRPFALFGHSMGAVIAFELARLLRRAGGPAPSHLFVSGRRAPQTTAPPKHTYLLPDDELIEEVRGLNGTPPEVLEHEELMRLMLPMLRADFALIQTYEYVPEPPLDCPVTAFGGAHDEDVGREAIEAWREQTASSFAMQMFDDGHFFLNNLRPQLLQAVSRELHRQRFVRPSQAALSHGQGGEG
ncbi:MAG TPA: alpha/beta fold hydrolase [Pyrinomonadaceae bacterium]|jgi:medium-chain acyl-[acyl-carrier-protein] hydrolase